VSKIVGITFIWWLLASHAHAITLAQCGDFASALNKNYPSRADNESTVLGAVCVPGSKRPSLIYRIRLDAKKSDITQTQIESTRQTQLQTWCTDPSQLKLFKLVDIGYMYTDSTGAFVGEISHAIENCPR
jgi:hypothetical protein